MSDPQKKKSERAGSQQTNKYAYTLANSLHLVRRPKSSANQENRLPEDDSDLAVSLPYDKKTDELYQRWLSLSPREQDVIALTCLGYKNQQIAFRLGLSVGTVKSYLQNVCYKLDLHSKTEIRLTFVYWDFSAWE
jgi:DNA-binding NarL/FixJ family response regulator